VAVGKVNVDVDPAAAKVGRIFASSRPETR
jgi:hypothetical protein